MTRDFGQLRQRVAPYRGIPGDFPSKSWNRNRAGWTEENATLWKVQKTPQTPVGNLAIWAGYWLPFAKQTIPHWTGGMSLQSCAFTVHFPFENELKCFKYANSDVTGLLRYAPCFSSQYRHHGKAGWAVMHHIMKHRGGRLFTILMLSPWCQLGTANDAQRGCICFNGTLGHVVIMAYLR